MSCLNSRACDEGTAGRGQREDTGHGGGARGLGEAGGADTAPHAVVLQPSAHQPLQEDPSFSTFPHGLWAVLLMSSCSQSHEIRNPSVLEAWGYNTLHAGLKLDLVTPKLMLLLLDPLFDIHEAPVWAFFVVLCRGPWPGAANPSPVCQNGACTECNSRLG